VLALTKELIYITDPKKQELAKEAIRKTSYDIVKEPASSTGNYHPEHDLGIGGVIRHTKVVFYLCKIAADSLEDLIDHNALFISAICHDLCKVIDNPPEGIDYRTHPLLMANILKEVGLEQEADIVASHMGRWNTIERKGRETIIMPLPSSLEGQILHLCDNMSSKKKLVAFFDENNELIEDTNALESVRKYKQEEKDIKAGKLPEPSWLVNIL
jgi:23S rRNA maturation-related 3'-5' exoribonuclease YhaM